MFCQSCGASLTKGLAYCNRCGAKIVTEARAEDCGPPHNKLGEVLGVLATALGFTALGGFAFIYLLVTKLLQMGLEQGRVMVITFFSLAAVVGVLALIVSQFSRVLKAFLGTDRKVDAHVATPELSGRSTAQIDAPREPASSITDHTTRTFDPVYVERDKAQAQK